MVKTFQRDGTRCAKTGHKFIIQKLHIDIQSFYTPHSNVGTWNTASACRNSDGVPKTVLMATRIQMDTHPEKKKKALLESSLTSFSKPTGPGRIYF